MIHKIILVISFALFSWLFAWIPALWCGLDTFSKVVQPLYQIPTKLVPFTEITSQALGAYGVILNNNPFVTLLYVLQGFAFTFWTISFLAFKSKMVSLSLTLIALIASSGMLYFDGTWLFIPLVLHKAYDLYWTYYSEIN